MGIWILAFIFYACETTVSESSNIDLSKYTEVIEFHNKAMDEVFEVLNRTDRSEFNRNTANDILNEVVLKDSQITIFEELFQKLEGVTSIDEVKSIVSAINEKALLELSEEDHDIILLATTMLSNSTHYWFENPEDWLALIDDDKKEKLRYNKAGTPWYISVAKADMVGLVSGAVSGFIFGGYRWKYRWTYRLSCRCIRWSCCWVSLGLSAGAAIYALFE